MFKVKRKETVNLNHKVNQLKQDKIKEYHKELTTFLKDVTILSLRCMYNNNCTTFILNMSSPSNPIEKQLVELVSNPPHLGDLSLPEFLGQSSKDGNKYDIIDLPKGYLYVYVKENSCTFQYHVDKPDHLNPYLDVNKSFKSELPTLLRDNGIVMTGLYSISRVVSVIKML